MERSVHNNTAILVFSRSARIEEEKKKFVFGKSQRQARQVVQTLNRYAQKTVRASKLPLIIGDEQHQSGQNFGQRLESAFRYAFQQGFDRVIAIGNDCLSLSKEDLRQAKTLLQTNEMVLGPAFDGGVYLLGLTKIAFDKITFSELPWQTESLYQALRQISDKAQLSNTAMHWAMDADDPISFHKAYQQLGSDTLLKKQLDAIFLTKGSFKHFYLSPLSFKAYRATFQRGPPVSSF